MLPKVVLFDYDGTLADTLPIAFQAFQAVFDKYDGRKVTVSELIDMFGPTDDEIIAINFSDASTVPQAIEDYYELYRQGHLDDAMKVQDISNLLTYLKNKGIKIGVITGKSRKSFIISSEALGQSDYFDLSITGDDVEQPKPHPEGILTALHTFGVSKEEAMFLGGSNADIRAGLAAGVRTYGVHWLPTVQSASFETAPDRIFTSTDQFIRLLQEEER
ncbi:HAD family hydrolase [Paenibacillus marinisediminis]